ncbi:hypothetical protein [Breznakiella homolactica]|uniref:PorV/PorQ family protein n=1 Tax=Breznakiella homolactica TaxID=2798577 RepID=A0A7T7XJY7_9SPIR|nr:hypothetical protein [Breznakiella homolactica]QQO07558.1 hypothetical protein JFL75_11420 [Breznakiella homolactica]
MGRCAKIVLFSIGSFFCCISLFGLDIAPFTMPSARYAAMGGQHAALADDFYGLFLNPASFVGIEKQFSAAEISVSVYGPVFELIDLALQSPDDLDISGVTGSNGFAAGLDIGGPIALGWVGKGIGAALFNRTTADATVTGAKIRPVVSEEILLVAGYSFRVVDRNSHVLDLGFLGKGFFRATLNMETSIFAAESLLEDPFASPFSTTLGFGFDLGIRYVFRERFGASLVCHDVYSPAFISTYSSFDDFIDGGSPTESGEYGTVKRMLNIGFSYKVTSETMNRYVSNLTLLLDYRDITDLFSDLSRNPILNIGIGAEMTVLEILSLRLGVTDALPSVGFGLDLSFMELDFAIRGREFGKEPGSKPVYALDFGLLFRY